MPKDSNQPNPSRAARMRKPRGSLSQDAILDAAEALAESGFDGVTMRAVAARLGAVPMALYNHFETKEKLVNALLDRVLGRFEPVPATDDWIEDLRSFAHAHRRVLTEHPWAVAPLFSSPSPGLSAVRIGEHALAILERGGLSDAHAVAAFSGLIALNYGWSSFTTAREAAGDIGAALEALPPEAFPLTVRTAGEMAAYGSEDHYEFVLGRFLGGLRLER
jgi:AcrR family transcriptional regulator